jgi:hypothetical protein
MQRVTRQLVQVGVRDKALQHLVDTESCRCLPWRELFEGCQEASYDSPSRNEKEQMPDPPVVILGGFHVGTLVGIPAEVEQLRDTQLH